VSLGTQKTLNLRLSSTFVPSLGQEFVLIDNDGSDAISGSFSGLPEGAILSLNGADFEISYVGGDGNDLSVTCVFAPRSWNGSVNALWSTPGNWTPSGVPLAGEGLLFPTGASNLTTSNDLPAGMAFSRLILTGSNYTLNGNGIELIDALRAESGVSNNLINLPIDVASHTVTFAGSGRINGLRIAGSLSGSGPITVAATQFCGWLELSGSHSYSGTIAIEGVNCPTFILKGASLPNASLRLRSSAAIGNGTIGPLTWDQLSSLTVAANNAVNVSVDTTIGQLNTSDLDFSATGTLYLDINGITPGVSHDQIRVTGNVSLGTQKTLNLRLSSTFVPSLGQEFVLIDNDGSDAISGSFSGLPDGTTVLLGGFSFELSYGGGDGNDLTLTSLNGLPETTTSLASSLNPSNFGQLVTFTATVMGSGPTPSGTVNFRSGSTLLGTGSLNASGVASQSTSMLADGSHTITAEYLGGGYGGSSSPPLTQVVLPIYSLSYSAGTGGSISGTTPQQVPQGSDGTPVTAVPDPNYLFVQWSDGQTDNPRTDTNVSQNISVVAEFTVISPTLSIDDVTAAEGNSGITDFVFTVTRSHTLNAVSVQVDTADGLAIAGSDYTSISGLVLNFPAGGAATATVTVQVQGDTIVEPDETFFVNLSNPTGATIADGQGVGTIQNDDSASIAINNVSQAEGNTGTTDFSFTVSLTGAVQDGFTVPLSSADGTATAGSDYTAIPPGITLSFAGTAGESQTITVQVIGDSVLEPDETFLVNLGAPSNPAVTVTQATGTGTIENDDVSTVAINDLMLPEGNSGTTSFSFTVTLTGAVDGGFSIPVESADGTATAGSDYVAIPPGTNLNFTGTDGETRTITVEVNGDTVLEPNETFSVTLGTPTNAAVMVTQAVGTATLLNDDLASVSIDDVSLTEGNAGTTGFHFSVTLTGAVQDGFTLPYASADGSAGAPGDYSSVSGTLNFTGTDGETYPILVQVLGDTIVETDEQFLVNLGTPSNPLLTPGAMVGTGTIENDDSATVAIDDVVQAEGDSGFSNFVFTLTLDGNVQDGFQLPWSTSDGTATAGSDYVAGSGTLNFTGGDGETRPISVAVVGDLEPEFDEEFHVDLGSASLAGVTAMPAGGTGVIINDDFSADVVVTIDNGQSVVFAGQTTTYTLVVSNSSAVIDVPEVRIQTTLPPDSVLQGLEWSCSGSGGASCPASGTGLIDQLLAMPRGSSLAYTISASVALGVPLPAIASLTATATLQPPYSDPVPANNSATDSDPVVGDGVFANGFEIVPPRAGTVR
jgi:hypothetical protein